MAALQFLKTYFREEMTATKPSSAVTSQPIATASKAPKTCHIFTDGACSDNGRRGARAGFGVHVYSVIPGCVSLDKSQPLSSSETQTNNRAELRAIQAALDLCDAHKTNIDQDYTEVCIWSDSEYSIHCLTKWASGWKRRGWKKADGGLIQNLDLIRSLYDRLQAMPYVRLQHVRAHQDTRKDQFPWSGNAMADKLARQATILSVRGTYDLTPLQHP